MTDITKCAYGCSKKLLCKRWTAPTDSFRQSVASFEPDPSTGICAHFYPNAVALAQEVETDRKLINHNED